MDYRTARTCDAVAFHETGHIVFACLQGYRCEYVQLNRVMDTGIDTWTARTSIDFLHDAFYVSRYIGIDADIQFFKKLDIPARRKSIRVGHRLSQVLLAGSVVEWLYKQNFKVESAGITDIEWIDMIKVDYISYALSELDGNHDASLFIPKTIQQIIETIKQPEISDAIQRVAELIRVRKTLKNASLEEALEGIAPDYQFGRKSA
jgi:hypothetical protein